MERNAMDLRYDSLLGDRSAGRAQFHAAISGQSAATALTFPIPLPPQPSRHARQDPTHLCSIKWGTAASGFPSPSLLLLLPILLLERAACGWMEDRCRSERKG